MDRVRSLLTTAVLTAAPLAYAIVEIAGRRRP